MSEMKKIIKLICPPFIVDLYRHLYKSRYKNYGFFGNYETWDVAVKKCAGYDSDVILNKVKTATLKVKRGEAVFERDSVVFKRPEYNFALLSNLLYVANNFKGKLRIIDFGGSLGGTYFQCRQYLSSLDNVEWSIVEQRHFIDCGKEWFSERPLDFFYTIEECLNKHYKDLVLLSSVLQYLDEPYIYLQDILKYNFPYIIVDRTPFFDFPDRITIQKVPPEIYDASYPAWFFNRDKFIDFISSKYNILAEWDSFEEWQLSDTIVRNKGMLLQLKNL